MMRSTFWLTIAPEKHSLGLVYDVTLIGYPPTTEPLTIQVLPTKLLDFLRAAKDMVHTEKTSLDVRTVYGNALAHWLFGDTTTVLTGEQITQCLRKGTSAGPLNPIGQQLKDAAQGAAEDAAASSRIRLFVHVEEDLFLAPEFLYCTFFQSLSANQLVRLDAVRSVWNGQAASSQNPASVRPPVAERLRVLLVLSNPKEYPENTPYRSLPDAAQQFDSLIAELDPLAQHQALVLSQIRQPSIDTLHERLKHFRPHVFVFLGHGFHHTSNTSIISGLWCVDQRGYGERWEYHRLQEILDDQKVASEIRLVVFLSCQSFIAAPDLLSLGVPAVVGMQPYLFNTHTNCPRYDFPLPSLVPFAKPLFEALAKFDPITTAFQDGVEGVQNATTRETHDQLRVAPVMPTLWLAGPEDHLFAAGPERSKRLYQEALLSKIMLCEWAGHDRVAVDTVFVDLPLQNARTGHTVTCDDILSSGEAVALEGPEWSGKTTLAHWLVSLAFQSEKTPILVNLRAMNTLGQTLEPWLGTFCRDWLGLNFFQEVTDQIMRACRAGQAVLVIDDVDPEWMMKPLHALKQHLFDDQEATITTPIIVTVREGVHDYHADWTHLRIQPLCPIQQLALVKRYGTAVNATPATEDFLRRIDHAHQQPKGVTALAKRPGFLADLLAQFLRQGTLVTEEADLLDRRQQYRWRMPIGSPPSVQPDEPVYKQRLLDALGFHLYCCRHGQDTAGIDEYFMQTILKEQPIYGSEQAGALLQEFVEARPFLHQSAPGEWTFRSPEWLRFYAASQIAALVNDRDEAILGWLTDGRLITCRLCAVQLPPFVELANPAQSDAVQHAVVAAQEEQLPAWRRTDPWDCPGVRELRSELVRALRLPPANRQ